MDLVEQYGELAFGLDFYLQAGQGWWRHAASSALNHQAQPAGDAHWKQAGKQRPTIGLATAPLHSTDNSLRTTSLALSLLPYAGTGAGPPG